MTDDYTLRPDRAGRASGSFFVCGMHRIAESSVFFTPACQTSTISTSAYRMTFETTVAKGPTVDHFSQISQWAPPFVPVGCLGKRPILLFCTLVLGKGLDPRHGQRFDLRGRGRTAHGRRRLRMGPRWCPRRRTRLCVSGGASITLRRRPRRCVIPMTHPFFAGSTSAKTRLYAMD